MTLSLDFASLRRAYAERIASPISVAGEVLERIDAHGADGVWISRVPADELLGAEGRTMEARPSGDATLRPPLRGQGQYRCGRSPDDRGLSRFRPLSVALGA